MSQIRILVATPCYGNRIAANYMMSFLDSSSQAAELGLQLGLILLGNYSSVSDARNFCASAALRDGWDKVFFIDADQSWDWAHAEPLLKSQRFVVGGTTPLKRTPIELSFLPLTADYHYFNPPPEASQGKTLSQAKTETILWRSPENFARWATAEASEDGEVQVAGLMGGFTLISRLVLEKMSTQLPSYQDRTTGRSLECWEFFTTGIAQDGGRLTEDYAFCAKAEKAGFDSYLNVKSVIRHEGNAIFECPQITYGKLPLEGEPELPPEGKQERKLEVAK